MTNKIQEQCQGKNVYEQIFLFAQKQVFEGGKKSITQYWNKRKIEERDFDSQICVFTLFFYVFNDESNELGYGC